MSAQDSFTDRLKTIAEGVLTLEVNTIVCPHIEAEKMPQPEHALIDIANEYGAWLRDKHGQADVFQPGAPSRASAAVFQDLRARAVKCLAEGQNTNLLERIRKNSDQIVGIFLRLDRASQSKLTLTRSAAHLPDTVELTPDEIVVVRKAWELMLEEIALQTTIQIDGDVMMRLLRRPPDGVDMAQVMKAHERAVDVSTRFWADLVSLIGGALKGLGQFLSSGNTH